jgi:hypothetical protein
VFRLRNASTKRKDGESATVWATWTREGTDASAEIPSFPQRGPQPRPPREEVASSKTLMWTRKGVKRFPFPPKTVKVHVRLCAAPRSPPELPNGYQKAARTSRDKKASKLTIEV